MSDKEIENFIIKEKSLKKRIKFLLENEILSDFKCLVGKDGPEQKSVPCHKFVFAITSYEFYNLFVNFSSNETVIKLPEICYTSFKQFLRYVYTEEISLNHKNIIEILILSRRFQIDHLRDFCFTELRKILQKNREVDLIQQILKNSFIFRSVDYKFFLNEIIGKNPLKYLNDKNIGVLRKTDLEIILKTSKSDAKENDFFQIAILWAKTGNKEGTGLQLRNYLQELVKLIRFPIMTCEEFHACLKENEGFLTTEEIFQIIFFITDKKGATVFETEMREGKTKSKPKIEPKFCILSIQGNKDGPKEYANLDHLFMKAIKTIKFFGVGIQLSTEALNKVQKAEIEICVRDRFGDVLAKTILAIEKPSKVFPVNKPIIVQRCFFKPPVILQHDVPYIFSARIRIVEGSTSNFLGCGVSNDNRYSSDGNIFDLLEFKFNSFINEILYEIV